MRRCNATRASRSLVAPSHFAFVPSGSFIHHVEEVLSTPLSVYVGWKTHPVPFAARFAIRGSCTTSRSVVQDAVQVKRKVLCLQQGNGLGWSPSVSYP